MNDDALDEIAVTLLQAERSRTALDAFTSNAYPDLDESSGYAVQDRTLRVREGRGERLIGVKLGLTSKAKQRRMNVDVPLVGWITDAHRLQRDQPLPAKKFIHPRVEPEIFFTLSKDLEGPGVTPEQAGEAVGAVFAGLDVIDSRFTDYRFALGDVVADNCSSGGFVVGPVARELREIDLELEAVVVEIDGAVVDTATGAAILGHPLKALAEGANILAARGLGLKAGQIVLAGALTDAIPYDPKQSVAFHFSTLGSIRLPAEES